MYRYRRPRQSLDELGLDSLMDVLTCSVGVMLFIVIIAVMEAKGTSVAMYSPPLLREPPTGAERILVICSEGRVRILDDRGAQAKLLEGFEDLTYSKVPEFVTRANRLNVSDEYFRYTLGFREEQYGEYNRKRVVSMRVELQPGVQGESREELRAGGSLFERALDNMNPRATWLAFGVDKESVAVFREAREIANRRDLLTGWEPLAISFPYEEIVLGGDLRQHVDGRPESGLEVVQ